MCPTYLPFAADIIHHLKPKILIAKVEAEAAEVAERTQIIAVASRAEIVLPMRIHYQILCIVEPAIQVVSVKKEVVLKLLKQPLCIISRKNLFLKQSVNFCINSINDAS